MEPFLRASKRSVIMVLSLYSTYRAWRRDVAAEKAAGGDGETQPGIG